MLIQSHRHRPKDLALWSELEAADLVHGQRFVQSDKLQRSIDEVSRVASFGPVYISFSGGKDSTALLAVCQMAEVRAPVVWFRAIGNENPDNTPVLAAIEARFGIAVDVIDYWSIGNNQAGSPEFKQACRDYQKKHGIRIMGVRADESGVRKIKMRRWGLSTANSSTPIGWWTTADVFGFLAALDLPVHPSYAMLGGGRWPREHLRVDALFGESGDQFGREQWEQEYYGDVLRRLEITGQLAAV